MDATKKLSVVKKVLIALLVVATLVFFYGSVSAAQAGEEREVRNAAEDVMLTVTGMSVDYVTTYSITMDFFCTIKNDSDIEMDRITGQFIIKDLDGNILSEGEAYFSGNFKPESENKFSLSWRMDITPDAKKVYEAAFEDLQFSFEITEITYDGYETGEID